MKKIVNWIILICSIVSGLVAVCIEFDMLDYSLRISLIFNVLALLLAFIHYRSLSESLKSSYEQWYILFGFVLYLILLSSLLFIDRSFLRDVVYTEGFFAYAKDHLNLIPFRTILLYIRGTLSGALVFSDLVVNLFGNIAAFMPFGFFLPKLFPDLRQKKSFILTMIGIIGAIEIMQFVLRTGVCDIDDLLLNLLGAYLVFKFLNKRLYLANKKDA